MRDMNAGRTAIVTGSTKGIGLGIAKELHSAGMNVVITSRHLGDAEKAAAEFSRTGERLSAIGLEFDIENRASFETLIQGTLNAFGRIDVLVNNALSQSTVFDPETLSDEQIEKAFTYGLTNIFLLSKRIFPELKKTQGNIINIASIVVNRHAFGMPLYTITKGAINQMTKVLAAEWAPHQVRVNSINPGFIYSNALPSMGMPDDVVAKYYEFCKQYHPLGRIGKPEDIGKLAAFLASEDASFMTGAVINSDAGYSIQGVNVHPDL